MNSIIINGVEYRRFNQFYAVSQMGGILRLSDNKVVSPHITKHGYCVISQYKVHRMVAVCWIERPEGANHVHHIDGNRANNQASNLMWVTPKQHLGDLHKGHSTNSPRFKGHHHSEESKKKISEASIRRGCKPPSWAGKTHTPETIAKMQTSASHRKCPCEINGIHYDSFKAAGIALGISRLAIRQRCHSPNFPDYRLL